MILSESTWRTAADLSSAVSDLETFREYSSSLRLANGPVAEEPGFLNSLVRVLTGGLADWEGHLWMLGHWVSGDTLWNLEATAEGRRFVSRAVHVSNAAALLVMWFRTRLPAYPYQDLPQLAEGTDYTTPEFSAQIRWQPRAQSTALQFVDFPGSIATLLGASPGQARSLRNAAVALLQSFKGEELMLRHLELQASLRADDVAALRACRSQLTASLTSIDEHDSTFAVPRHQFRQTRTRDAVAELKGLPYDYASSFDELNNALNMVLATTVPLLAVYGTPSRLGPMFDVAIDGTDGLTLEGTVTPSPEKPFPRVGRIYDVRSSGFEDPLFVTGHTMNSSPSIGTVVRVRGELLQRAHDLLA